ncbi:uncharacterized protein LOC131167457 [Malania oleifera]|uniref:uncharacterized protein LOC131167457 n=1 Tax=Malania oleifera TaxID=397392 RepID=UPI0025AEBE65|nr:uncharacterized protein LOC131167457 [Malania oleifera]
MGAMEVRDREWEIRLNRVIHHALLVQGVIGDIQRNTELERMFVTSVRNTAQAWDYALTPRDAEVARDVVTGMIIALSYKVVDLLDSSATHSFMSLGYVKMTGVETQLLDIDLSLAMLTRSIVRYRRLLSAIQARNFLLEGCHGYLACVKEVSEEEIKDIPEVRDFLGVFAEDLSKPPPDREVEFVIDPISGTTLISKTPYRMAPAALKELKEELQDLLDKGFI